MLTYILFMLAVECTYAEDYEESEKILNTLPQTLDTDFYRMVNNYKLNNKPLATKYSTLVIDDFNPPLRYKEVALGVRQELSTWIQKDDDLDDIAREMTKVANRLKNGKNNTETRAAQNKILDRLAKIIKDKQAAKDKADEQKQHEEKEKAEKEAELRRIIESHSPSSPAPDSHLPGASGTGSINRQRLREINATWGKLPEKERAKVMAELKRSLPRKDQRIIDEYIRRLNRR